MFGRFAKHSAPKNTSSPASRKTLPSVISADMHVLGNIISTGLLDIDGQIDGNITCHTASIRPNGRVRGDIQAENVHIHGAVDGVVKARAVSLYHTAKVRGTIMHETMSMEDGAEIDGKCKRVENLHLPTENALVYLPKYDASLDSDNDNDQSPEDSAEEMQLLEHLRLIS